MPIAHVGYDRLIPFSHELWVIDPGDDFLLLYVVVRSN